jgi:hypothetical protein
VVKYSFDFLDPSTSRYFPWPEDDIAMGEKLEGSFTRIRPVTELSLMSTEGVATHKDVLATVTRSVRSGRTKAFSLLKFVGSILNRTRPLSGAGISKAYWPVAHQRAPSPNATLVSLGYLAAALIRHVLRLIRMRSSVSVWWWIWSNVPSTKIESFPAPTMKGPAPSVAKVRLRLTEKSELEFGGVAAVLASVEATAKRLRADIAATVRTANLQVIRRACIATLPLCAQRYINGRKQSIANRRLRLSKSPIPPLNAPVGDY